MVISRKGVVAVVVFFVLVGPMGYTLASYVSEPHPVAISLTSESYARTVAISANGSISTLFFHTFAVGGSTATYGFSLHGVIGDYYSGNQVVLQAFVTLANRSLAFPYNSFFIEVSKVNLSIQINGTSYGTALPISLGNGQNGTVRFIGMVYGTNRSIEINNHYLTRAGVGNVEYSGTCNITYGFEVTPVVEFGPYYAAGTTQWISHTFEYPFVE